MKIVIFIIQKSKKVPNDTLRVYKNVAHACFCYERKQTQNIHLILIVYIISSIFSINSIYYTGN